MNYNWNSTEIKVKTPLIGMTYLLGIASHANA